MNRSAEGDQYRRTLHADCGAVPANKGTSLRIAPPYSQSGRLSVQHQALTFTIKAAKEIGSGSTVVGAERGNLWMGTFHSVFARSCGGSSFSRLPQQLHHFMTPTIQVIDPVDCQRKEA